ncbi:hypothetical protein ACFQ3Z_14805 [Streptomyces nogalater]
MGLLHGGGPREQRLDVLLAFQLGAVEGDGDPYGGVPSVAHRCGDGADLGERPHQGGEVGGGRVGVTGVEPSAAGLGGDQDVFDGPLLQPALGGDRLTASRLADTEVLGGRRVGADGHADSEAQHDEHQPADDAPPGVGGTPAGDTHREILHTGHALGRGPTADSGDRLNLGSTGWWTPGTAAGSGSPRSCKPGSARYSTGPRWSADRAPAPRCDPERADVMIQP